MMRTAHGQRMQSGFPPPMRPACSGADHCPPLHGLPASSGGRRGLDQQAVFQKWLERIQ
jgi:hypothetical protein